MMNDILSALDLSPARGKRLLVALSGGADSVALLHLLSRARREWDLALFAAHVDHGIRRESGADAEFCRELCQRLEVPLRLAKVDVPAAARASGRGLETEARSLRHRALRAFRDAVGADLIVTAHHMDDQAETVLMHLARGAGLDGLAGIAPLANGFFRPLLGLRKAELVEYLAENGLSWVEDATNAVDDNPRNALRLHVIPELEKSYPQFVRAAARCAETARLEGDCLDALAADYCARRGGACPGLCAWLNVEAPPHRALLRRALRRMYPGPETLSWAQVNALEALCAQARGKLDLDDHCRAERTGRRLYFVQKRPGTIPPVELKLEGTTRAGSIGEIVARACAPVPLRHDPMVQALSAPALGGAVVRTRRDGDRIRPLGCGDRLISDYLIDKKLDRPLRDALLLVARDDRVLWACGLGISEDARLRSPSDAAVRLECRYTFDMTDAINKC